MLEIDVIILTDPGGEGQYRVKRLVSALTGRNLRAEVYVPARLSVWLDGGLTLRSPSGIVQPRIVVNALHHPNTDGLALITSCERYGIPVLNGAEAWRFAKVKPLMSVALTAAGVPHPRTAFIAGSYQGVAEFKAESGTVVAKPWRGSSGRGVKRFGRLGRRRRPNRRGRGEWYVQAYVPNPRRDIRTVVLGAKVIGATFRYAPVDGWKTNVASGGRPERCEVDEAMRAISLAATEAVGLEYAGVDLIESPTGLKVLEVNAWPNYHVFDRVSGVDVAALLAEHIHTRLQSERRKRVVERLLGP